jgi:hypothetical protein
MATRWLIRSKRSPFTPAPISLAINPNPLTPNFQSANGQYPHGDLW